VSNSFSFHSIVTASRQQASRQLGEETVILHFTRGMYFGLNAVGARVWALLETPTRVSDIHAAILEEFDVDSETCARDVLALLEQLSDRELIEVVS
jgi:coenzyme PQQ synthesis protein D (PqqD)